MGLETGPRHTRKTGRNCGRLEKALWRVADWPVVGAATKELEKRGVVLDHRTPEVVHFVHQPRHGFVDPA